MMGALGGTVAVGRRHRFVAPLAVVCAGLSLASAAWACAPVMISPDAGDATTLFHSCTAPAGATYKCKPTLGTPTFPNATSIQGAARSTFSAYVVRGLIPGMKYDLQFATKSQQKSGIACSASGAVVLNGPVLADPGGAIAPTAGTIPASAPLGLGQVCFSDVSYDTAALQGQDPNEATMQNHSSSPASFKVIL